MGEPDRWGILRHSRWLDALVILLVAIATIFLAQLLLGILLKFDTVPLLFFVSWLVAFLLTPLRKGIEALRVPRVLAAISLYLLLFAGITVLGLIFIPRAIAEGNGFVQQAPSYATEASRWINWGHSQLTSIGVDDNSLVTYARAELTRLQETTVAASGNLLGAATGLASILVDIFIVLVLSFYMLLDGDSIVARCVSLTPPRLRGAMTLFVDSVAQSFGAFARTQFILAALAAVTTFIVLTFFGVGYASAAAILAGIGMLIPFFGPVLALVPPLAIAAFWVTSVGEFIWLAVILWVIQQALVNVLVPRLMGQVVGIHPLMVLFGLLAGAAIAGPWGALFGVPVTAVAFMMLRSFYHQVLQASTLYSPIAPEAEPMSDVVPMPEIERVTREKSSSAPLPAPPRVAV